MAKRKHNRGGWRDQGVDPFGPWEKAVLTGRPHGVDLQTLGVRPTAVWCNRVYQVLVFRDHVHVPGWPKMHWLSIKRRDKAPIHDWRDLQRIKNELIGPTHEAVELYPAEARLIDTSNQYHLHVLAQPGLQFPFGFTQRAVCVPHAGGPGESRQRPWPPGQEPKDAMTEAQFSALCDDAIGPGVHVGTPQMPTYVPREAPCATCGAAMDPHICGVGQVGGEVRRFPIYTGRAVDVADVGGPHPIEEGARE
jgi:hypothetical protein